MTISIQSKESGKYITKSEDQQEYQEQNEDKDSSNEDLKEFDKLGDSKDIKPKIKGSKKLEWSELD